MLALRGEDALVGDGVADQVALALAAGLHHDRQTAEGVEAAGEAAGGAGGRRLGEELRGGVARGADLLLLLGGDLQAEAVIVDLHALPLGAVRLHTIEKPLEPFRNGKLKLLTYFCGHWAVGMHFLVTSSRLCAAMHWQDSFSTRPRQWTRWRFWQVTGHIGVAWARYSFSGHSLSTTLIGM